MVSTLRIHLAWKVEGVQVYTYILYFFSGEKIWNVTLFGNRVNLTDPSWNTVDFFLFREMKI